MPKPTDTQFWQIFIVILEIDVFKHESNLQFFSRDFFLICCTVHTIIDYHLPFEAIKKSNFCRYNGCTSKINFESVFFFWHICFDLPEKYLNQITQPFKTVCTSWFSKLKISQKLVKTAMSIFALFHNGVTWYSWKGIQCQFSNSWNIFKGL